MHCTPSLNLLKKLERLVKAAGFEEIDFNRKMTAIKVHFGEPGNLAFLRPNFAARVAAMIKEKGGKPYLTDCNTLYYGRRSNAVDHLEAAMENGFNRIAVGCDVIIADGLTGSDDEEIPVNLKHTKTAKIGSVIADFILLGDNVDICRWPWCHSDLMVCGFWFRTGYNRAAEARSGS